MPYLDRDGDVAILDLGDRGSTDTENRFHPDWLTALEDLLDEVEGTEGPVALVTTATGKFFSNGLDLDWVSGHPDQWKPYVDRVQALLSRVLTLPLMTVSAIPGHAFAAGAMLALCHDRRIMRADRGFFCLPEVDINIPFSQGMSALIMHKLPRAAAHELMTTGRRYGGSEALAAGIVDDAAAEGEVLERAIAWAAALAGKRGPTLGTIKSVMYADVVAALCLPS